MALNFTQSEKNYTLPLTGWKGLDYDTFVDNTELTRSKNMKNMLVNESGFVEKRTGYKRIYENGTEEKINGIFTYNALLEGITDDSVTKTSYNLIHIGTKLYLFDFDINGNIERRELLLEGLRDEKTRAFEFNGSLFIVGAGYIRVCIDKFTNKVMAGFISQAGTKMSVDDVDNIITNRHPNSLDGEYSMPDSRYIKKSITYTRKIGTDDRVINFNTNDKFYVAKAKNTEGNNAISIIDVIFYDAGGHDYSSYITYNGSQIIAYHVAVDEEYGTYVYLDTNFGMTVNTGNVPSAVDKIEIVFTDISFVSVPLTVSGRNAFWIAGDTGEDGSEEGTRYTGTYVQGVNMLSKQKAVSFFYSKAAKGDSVGKIKVKLYLSEERTNVFQIRFNDSVWNYSELDIANDNVVFGTNYVILHQSVIPFSEGTITVYFSSGKIENDIDNCKIFGIYGGDNDIRVFLSGNEKHPCRDYMSGLYDATFFSDLGYTDVGGDNSAIVGYAKMYSSQIIIKDGAGEASTQYLRNTTTDGNGNTVYTVSQGANSFPASAVSSFKNIGGYPYYIGKDGFYMMYGTNVKMETNTGCKSKLINSVFTKEETQNFICTVHQNRFYAYINGHMYVCDIKHDHEWYYFDNLPDITCLWIWDNSIYFGTCDGRVCRFMDKTEKNAYCDNLSPDGEIDGDTEAIHALWEIPQSTYGTVTNYKTIRNVHFDCLPYTKSHVTVYYNSNEDLLDNVMNKEKICMFDLSQIDFSDFSFLTIQMPLGFATRVKNKNIYTFGITLENKEMGEPFGFAAVTVTYRTGKNVK